MIISWNGIFIPPGSAGLTLIGVTDAEITGRRSLSWALGISIIGMVIKSQEDLRNVEGGVLRAIN